MSDETKALIPEVITNRDPNPAHHVKTPEKADVVFRMAQQGLTKGATAKCLSISLKTLDKYYSEEFDAGVIDMQRSLSTMAFEAAAAGSIPMLIHLVKTKLGWNEHTTVEHVGEIRAIVSNKPLSKDEFVKRYITKEDDGSLDEG
jgi:hypothetical protein